MNASALDYQTAVDSAQNGNVEIRTALARDPSAPPEILYYLIDDPSPAVRQAVAENPATPRKADLILAKDTDIGVRCALARRLVGEGLDRDERAQLRRMAFTILETLARDTYVAVRRSLAEALAALAAPPKPIARSLARDPEREVAEPVLRSPTALEDVELAAMVRDNPADWALLAAAERPRVGPELAAAIAESGDEAAVRALLANDGADIAEADLERIVETAAGVESWHEALVRRSTLPARLVGRVARFVSGPLLAILDTRPDLPDETRSTVRAAIRARAADDAKQAETASVEAEPPEPVVRPQIRPERETPEDRARRLHDTGKLTDAVVFRAIENGDRIFVTAALALRAGVSFDSARAICNSRAGAVVAALCWKAGLDCATAMTVQTKILGMSPSETLTPLDGGYPMSASEMEFKLELYL